jgi:8-oxo-dGTP pyrophosphatase MutT (NUDIX family)
MSDSMLRIGCSGHQQIGDETTIEYVSERLRELLIASQQQAQDRGQGIRASSALAVGTDQLFVKTALELGIPVEVVIPCVQYEGIFTTVEARDEYHRLLSRCQSVHRLSFEDCSEDAYLAAGHWIVEKSDFIILVWNGYPAAGRGGTADVASYARFLGRRFVHLHTRLHTVRWYKGGDSHVDAVPRREFIVDRQTVYQGDVLTVNRYRFRFPDGEEYERDIVERPESVLVLPVGRNATVLLIEEIDLGAATWQLTIPGGRVIDASPEGLRKQAEIELREETGYRAGRIEKLLDFHSHPGYVAHKVHLFVAYDLEWDPLEMEDGEEIVVKTFTLDEALAATRVDYRCDPEAALALWLYASSLSAR